MARIAGDWTGKILGTNNGDIFVEIEQDDSDLRGTVRLNDPMYGTAVYLYTGTVEGGQMRLELDPSPEMAGRKPTTFKVGGHSVTLPSDFISLGHVTVTGIVVAENRIEGKWVSTVGTGGAFWIERAHSHAETVSKYAGSQLSNITFIMMSIVPDDPEAEDVLGAIKRASAAHGIQAVRVDEIEHSKKITDVILQKIRESRFLVCDISRERPNVYYELGFAHGIEKDVILVAREGTTLHFDIKDYNVIFYKSYAELERRVAKRIGEAIEQQSPAITNDTE